MDFDRGIWVLADTRQKFAHYFVSQRKQSPGAPAAASCEVAFERATTWLPQTNSISNGSGRFGLLITQPIRSLSGSIRLITLVLAAPN